MLFRALLALLINCFYHLLHLNVMCFEQIKFDLIWLKETRVFSNNEAHFSLEVCPKLWTYNISPRQVDGTELWKPVHFRTWDKYVGLSLSSCVVDWTGNYWDAASRCDMRLLLRHILRSTADNHRSYRTTARFRVNRLLPMRVCDT